MVISFDEEDEGKSAGGRKSEGRMARPSLQPSVLKAR